MNASRIRYTAAAAGAIAASLLLAACGGGAEGTGDAGPGPLPANIASAGAMTKGSVIVNGIRYDDTSSAPAAVIDDRGRRFSDLDDGFVIKLRGRTDDLVTGRADLVKVVNELRGTITAVGSGTPASIVVNGVTVLYDADPAVTVLRPSGTVLGPGTRVEVHGTRDSAGRLRATRIEVVAASDGQDELRGAVSAVSGNSVTLAGAAGITVNVAGASFLPTGTSAADLLNGTVIEVRGTLSGTAFNATAVVIDDRDDAARQLTGLPSDVRVQAEGFVTGFTGASAPFRVGDRLVRLAATVVYERGTALDLGNDVRVEVEGAVDATGTLVANKVQFRRPRTELTGPAQNVDPALRTFTVFGNAVKLDDLTEGSLPSAGQRVEVRGQVDASGAVVAERLRTSSVSNDDEIRAVVSGIDAQQRRITLLRNTCDLSTASLQNLDGTPADASAWFASLVVNRTVVKVKKGTITGSACTPEEAEIEN